LGAFFIMRTSLTALQERTYLGEKLVMLTCYDASFARISEKAGVDILLIGDSLGMVIQGAETTLSVTLESICYHLDCVRAGCQKVFLLADMPFGTYQISPEQAFQNAATLLAHGAQMVKIEGGATMVPTTRFLVERGIPVCAHLGLTPQSVHTLGGYRVQARDEQTATQLLLDAEAHVAAGAGMVLLEAIPSDLAHRVTSRITVPTIGIGAGGGVSGQVLVLQDILGISPRLPKFAHNFLLKSDGIEAAIRAYTESVRSGAFPFSENIYT
jgi:3-methyl-2-oxobutanoate hydroxymethyltransferase